MKISHLFESDLETEAAMVQFDNVKPGGVGHHEPSDATWREREVSLDKFYYIMGSKQKWIEWYNNEIKMHDEDGTGMETFYRDLINHPIDEPPIVLFKDGDYHIWDGFHRVAAAITRGDSTINCIVGVPKS